MDLLSLLVRIGADITGAKKGMAEAQSGMEATAKKSESVGKRISNSFKAAGKAIGAIAGIATGVASAATAAVVKLTTDAAAATDRIDKMSQKIGISRQSFQELDFIMSQSGGSVESLQVGMKTLRTQIDKVREGDEATVATFKKLGIAVTDSNGKLRKQEDIMFDAMQALQGVKNETTRATLATELFGKAGIEMMPLLNSGTGSIEAMRKQAQELGLVLDDDMIDAGVHLTDMIDQVTRSFNAITQKIGVQLMPVVQEILQIVPDNMPTIQKVIGKVFEILGAVVKTAVNLIKGVTRPIINLANTIVEKFGAPVEAVFNRIKSLFGGTFFKEVSTNLTNIGNAVGETVSKITTTVSGWMSTFLEKTGIGKFVDGFKTYVTNFFSTAVEIIKSALTGNISGTKFMFLLTKALTGGKIMSTDFGSFMDLLLKRVKREIRNFFTNVFGEGVGGALADLSSINIDLFKAITDTLTENFGPTVKAIKDLFGTIFDVFKGEATLEDVKTAAGKVKKAFLDIDWSGLWEDIKAAFETAAEKVREIDWLGIGRSIWNKIVEGLAAYVDWLKGVYDTFTEKVREIDFASIGKTIGDVIWGAIKTAFDFVVSFFSNLFGGENGSAKSAIGSVDWGGLGLSIWNAIKAAFDGIADFFKGYFTTAIDAVKSLDWKGLGDSIWGAIKRAFSQLGDIVKKLILGGDEYTPDSTWGDVGAKIWGTIKGGFETAGTWLKKLILGDKYEPDSSWVDVGKSIWNKIIDGMSAYVNWVANVYDTFTAKVKEIDFSTIGHDIGTTIGNAIKAAFDFIVDFFRNLFGGEKEDDPNSVKGAIANIDWLGLGTSIIGFIKEAFVGIADFFGGLFGGVWDAIKEIDWGKLGEAMWEAIKKAFSGITDWFVETFKTPINAVIGFLNRMIASIRDALNKVIDTINEKLTINSPEIHFLGINEPSRTLWKPDIQRLTWSDETIPALAKGGVVRPGGMAIVGEAGAELLRNVNGRAVVTPMGGTTGSNISINIYQQPGESAEALADKVQRVLVRRERQRRASFA